jgi:hypothetical protein
MCAEMRSSCWSTTSSEQPERDTHLLENGRRDFFVVAVLLGGQRGDAVKELAALGQLADHVLCATSRTDTGALGPQFSSTASSNAKRVGGL